MENGIRHYMLGVSNETWMICNHNRLEAWLTMCIYISDNQIGYNNLYIFQWIKVHCFTIYPLSRWRVMWGRVATCIWCLPSGMRYLITFKGHRDQLQYYSTVIEQAESTDLPCKHLKVVETLYVPTTTRTINQMIQGRHKTRAIAQSLPDHEITIKNAHPFGILYCIIL